MGTGRPLFAKLLLECKEVPFIGATISAAVGQAQIAYIDLVPHASINNIKPRTLVHLMVRDINRPDQGYPWVEAFAGEVFGFSFNKTPDSRSFSISCIDHSSYWDNAIIYFMNTQVSLGKGAQDVFQQGQANLEADAFTNGSSGVAAVNNSIASYFIQIFQDETDGGGDFLDGLVAVYDKMQNINSFYAAAEARLNIVDRIILHSSGKLTELLQNAEARDWLSGVVGKESGFQTLRMVVQDLMSIIFHDFVSVPFPAKVTTTADISNPLTGAGAGTKTIGEFVFKPNLYMLPPPMCNVFFPDEYSSFSYSRNFFQEPTRLIYQPEMPTNFGGNTVGLMHVYEPESLNFFMYNTGDEDFGPGPLQISEHFGNFNDSDPNAQSSETNDGQKREAQFLTNEEKMRGILMAIEHMIPANSSFRGAIADEGKGILESRVANYLFFKKRFQPRQLQITSHLKMSVVPGFPVLVLDDSDSQQHVLAYCSSVTHRIYATQGGYTNVQLGYARGVGEQDTISENLDEPPIPPWFDEVIFGKQTTDSDGNETDQVPKALSGFYASLLGDKGSAVLTDKYGADTVTASVSKLLADYRNHKSKGFEAVQTFIAMLTARDYVSMTDAFKFLGASTTTKNANTSTLTNLEFSGARITGTNPTTPLPGTIGPPAPFPDATQVQQRRAVIQKYRAALQAARGFRG